ncbi:hypothetical protein Cgig2_002083 [Carnegiea gigantea]|uniref:Uncharacterized protein n=1 Tax=Carnegiea gigantea TaxID=171969 RepID=A0A9Q1JUL4_9CARY|nr:hypothetical protein Cgig2_002083 [Carnegiea gigantea]
MDDTLGNERAPLQDGRGCGYGPYYQRSSPLQSLNAIPSSTLTSILVRKTTMYLTLENLRNMARPKRITSSPGGISRKDNINEYEMQRELNIQQNNRKLQELRIQRMMQAPRRANGSIQLRGEQNYEEDNEYHLTDDERVQAECDDVPFDTQRTTMCTTSLERQVTRIRSGNSIVSLVETNPSYLCYFNSVCSFCYSL